MARARTRRATRTRTRTPEPKQPRAQEAAYAAFLRRVSRAFSAEIRKAVKPLRLDAEDIDLRAFRIDMTAAEGPIFAIARSPTVRREVKRQAERLAAFNTRDLQRILRVSLDDASPAVAAMVEAFRDRNARLIRSIAERQIQDVRLLVGEAANSGMRVETLAARLLERYAVSESRATLIARDQILKTNSAFTQTRARELGVTEYVWSSSNDERVREMHAALDGQTFKLDDPPVTNENGDQNHPGTDYQCRCTMVMVVPS